MSFSIDITLFWILVASAIAGLLDGTFWAGLYVFVVMNAIVIFDAGRD